MSERQFQQQVIELAQLLGYRVAHFRPALRQSGRWATPVAANGAGFPDLVLVGRGRVIFVELKSERGRVRAEQQAWLDALQACNGVEVYLWRPSDWASIVETLKRP